MCSKTLFTGFSKQIEMSTFTTCTWQRKHSLEDIAQSNTSFRGLFKMVSKRNSDDWCGDYVMPMEFCNEYTDKEWFGIWPATNNLFKASHIHSPGWLPDSTGHRTHHSRRIWVSLVQHTAAWSRESSGADCLVVWGEQNQSLWFLSQSSHSRLWRAGSTKQFETQSIISLCSAKLLNSRADQIGHQDMSDQIHLTHVRVKQSEPCFVKTDCRVSDDHTIKTKQQFSFKGSWPSVFITAHIQKKRFFTAALLPRKHAHIQYLRFKVPVHHPYIMHVADSWHQLAHDAAGLRFTEMLLPTDPLQQFPSTK